MSLQLLSWQIHSTCFACSMHTRPIWTLADPSALANDAPESQEAQTLREASQEGCEQPQGICLALLLSLPKRHAHVDSRLLYMLLAMLASSRTRLRIWTNILLA